MPVYTYECQECGVRFNAKQSFSDAPIEVCPECGGHTEKVIGPVGIVFKGSGFYVTDSRSDRSSLTGTSKKKEESSESSNASSDA
ncbi:MAG: hypothetical protein Kow0077_15210 [Anaerolineae bacterium]